MDQPVSVLLDDPSALHDRLRAVGRVVATVLGEPVPDAAQRVRYGGGIVARAVSAPYARSIQRGLAALGLGSFTVDEETFVDPSRFRRVAGVSLAGDSLALTVRGDEEATVIPWKDVRAFHVVGLLEERGSEEREALKRHVPGAALPEDIQPLHDAIVELEERRRAQLRLSVDLFTDRASYRLHHDETSLYAVLEERTEHTLANFVLLVRALLDSAREHVVVPPSTVDFADEGELEGVVCTKREELAARTVWFVNALEHGVPFDDEPEDLDDAGLQDAREAVVVDPYESGDDLEDDELEDSDDEAEDDLLETEDDLDEQALVATEDDLGDEDDDVDLDDEELDAGSEADLDALGDEDGDDDLDDLDGEDGDDDLDGEDDDDDLDGEDDDDDLDGEDDDDDLDDEDGDDDLDDEDDVDLDDEELDAGSEADLDALGDDDDADDTAEFDEVAEHFAETGRLEPGTVAALLREAAGLEDVADDADAAVADPEVAEAMGFFDMNSGRWDVSKLLAESETIEASDLDA